METDKELVQEQKHLDDCLDVIRKNIKYYELRISEYKRETDELFQAIRKGDVELYDQLFASQNILEHARKSLHRNQAAAKKAFFGRIDYRETTNGIRESWYIGKNGISIDRTNLLIVDWRAPVSSVYYENEMGTGVYQPADDGEPVEIDLTKKRTYDVSGDRMLGYYDNDAVSNDELLVKYLAQNKEAVLGDIIATIQKEQNAIIRDRPVKNIIVQGVAGSGKTTVAMHRISYILYNYGNRYKSSEFCIVGSNDMLLSYITSGLPELDVNNVKQIKMDQFFPYLMEKAWKKKYKLIAENEETAIKSRLPFIRELEQYLQDYRMKMIPARDITDDKIGLVLSGSNIQETLDRFSGLSVAELAVLMNERLKKRICFLVDEDETEAFKAKIREYRKYFDPLKGQGGCLEWYRRFLERYSEKIRPMPKTLENLKKGHMDVYDMAAAALIWKRIFVKDQPDEFSQIIIDEAEDFGEVIYYSLQQVLPKCCFTIMGDVSQNINYETGMNEWDSLQSVLFQEGRDSFYLLSKSYRNTIEISEFAGKVLEKASAGRYKIQPVIRHGRPVERITDREENLAVRAKMLIKDIQSRGFDTIAVICRTQEEAMQVEKMLGKTIQGQSDDKFKKGVMVLPIRLTKGLEFDAVIIWKPDNAHYGDNPKDAKLMYVAVTRALHELYLLGTEITW